MFITTAGRTTESMIELTKEIGVFLELPYIPRKKQTVKQLQALYKQDCLVVGKEKLELYKLNESEPFFFHPSSANFRMKRLLSNQKDPLIEVCQLQEGMSFLDCTLGLGSDSIVASFIVGDSGKVTSIEQNKYIAYIVKDGLKRWDTNNEQMNEALRRIEVIHMEAIDFLQTLENNSYDVVYLDPMFETHIDESTHLDPLMNFAYFKTLDEQLIKECLRVAKNRVILKDHYESSLFKKYSFVQQIRKTAKFHYGILEKN